MQEKFNITDEAKDSLTSIMTILYASLLSTFALWKLYYCFQSLIWSYKNYPIEELTPWIAHWASFGELEVYALYILLFFSVVLSFFITQILKSAFIYNNIFIKYATYVSCSILLVLLLIDYSTKPVVFHSVGKTSISPIVFSALLLIIIMPLPLMYLQKKRPKTMMGIICIILFPIIFVATMPIVTYDYTFIFFPAHQWRLGVNVSDIYFTYGVLISYIAMLWMKAGMSLGSFQIIIQLSYYILLITMYLVSRHIFHNRVLPLLFIIFLVLIKVYFSAYGIVSYAQWSPIRLDLWILLFLIIFFKGPFHWLMGAACGFLILFSHNFGVIYTVAYVQLVLFLVLISLIDRKNDSTVIVILKRYLKKTIISIVLIGISFLICKFYFNATNDHTFYFMSLGIGVSRAPEGSLFWSYLIIIPTASLLLFDLRGRISPRYFELGFFLVFFSIGNLVYFFGQSTEMHIYLAGTPLIFLLFFILDLIRIKTSVFNSKFKFIFSNIDILLSIFFILIISFLCSDNIIHKLKAQYTYAINSQMHFDDPFLAESNKINSILSDIHAITNNSNRIQFFTLESKGNFTEGTDTEFLLYYHSNLISLSFVNPMFAQVLLDPLILHMQNLINNGYYLLVTADIYNKIFKDHLKEVDSIHPVQDKYVLISASDRVKNQKRIADI